jgi:hypothetical protein
MTDDCQYSSQLKRHDAQACSARGLAKRRKIRMIGVFKKRRPELCLRLVWYHLGQVAAA